MSDASDLGRLPVQGFVLAGGKSSRMGRDKATLSFNGQLLVEIAVGKLKRFCASVAIAGSRDDLRVFAPVVSDKRPEAGPAGGLEAALAGAVERWTLFLPVDVPLVPAELLRVWAAAVLASEQDGVRLSFLRAGGLRQPACCMLHAVCAGPLTDMVADGERKLGIFFERLAAALGSKALWIPDAEDLAGNAGVDRSKIPLLFSNVNTPEQLALLKQAVVGPGESSGSKCHTCQRGEHLGGDGWDEAAGE